MEDIYKNILLKISSYNIFNNFFPGIIFCYLIRITTKFRFDNGELWEKIFIYYFIGMVISRIGSIVIEWVLQHMKITNKLTKQKEGFICFTPYNKYVEASEQIPFIKELNETNNTYRTLTSVVFVTIIVKLYDLLYDGWIISEIKYADSIVEIIMLVCLFILFVESYRKQTNYIKKRVEKYFSDKERQEN